ncbi:MAG: LexA family transcriptional regulator [Arcobacteraceae bacterium]
MSFGDNLKHFRNIAKITQTELAKIVESLSGEKVTYENIKSWENGTNPKINIISFLSEALNITEQELFDNSGKSLEKITERELKKNPSKYLVPGTNENAVDIKYYENTYACQGSSSTANEDEIWKPLTFDKRFLQKQMPTLRKFNDLHIVNTIGNSMEPTIKEGELLIVTPFKNDNSTVISGAIYTVFYYGEAFVKRIVSNPKTGEITLHSDNANIHPAVNIEKEDEAEFEIIGRVLAHFDFF